MENARPRPTKMSSPDRDLERELQELLEAMTFGIVADLPATVACAKGRGFMHFEIRCTKEAHDALRNGRDAMHTMMKVAGAVRRIRVSLQFVEQELHKARSSEKEPPQRVIEALVLTMAKALADKPEEVVVFAADGDGFSHYDVTCDRSDAGTLIGSRATHANAMRGVLSAAGLARRMRASLQIMARDG